MALVSGQVVSSFAELNTSAYPELSNSCAAADSDDEYAYVSSLAEEIAHALMLDDDDDLPAQEASLPSISESWCREDAAWPSASLQMDKQDIESKHFATAWRANKPAHWGCFYAPPQQASKKLSILYTSHLDSKHCHMYQGLNSGHMAYNKIVAPCARDSCDLQTHEAHSAAHTVSSLVRKESIGTGVFLPKIVNSGPHYRRKSGFSLSKSSYAPRHKC